jgi:C4-dicarboxylate transporter
MNFMKNSADLKEHTMELNAENIVLFLLGLVQAMFFWNRHRDAKEVQDLKESIKETRKSISNMERILSNLEQQLAVANYALFKERKSKEYEK